VSSSELIDRLLESRKWQARGRILSCIHDDAAVPLEPSVALTAPSAPRLTPTRSRTGIPSASKSALATRALVRQCRPPGTCRPAVVTAQGIRLSVSSSPVRRTKSEAIRLSDRLTEVTRRNCRATRVRASMDPATSTVFRSVEFSALSARMDPVRRLFCVGFDIGVRRRSLSGRNGRSLALTIRRSSSDDGSHET
jgi:hypothetical protein